MEKHDIRVAIAFKDFSYWTGSSCVGLKVAAEVTAKGLEIAGIETTVFSVQHNIDLFYAIRDYNDSHKVPLSHVIVMAPWLSPLDLEALLKFFPEIVFTVQSHCNVGGLHGDVRGIGNFRQYVDLLFSYANLRVAGNSKEFAEWASVAYDTEVVLLPNIYPVFEEKYKTSYSAVFRIGAFGAIRPEKNFITAAGAALAFQRLTDRPVQFHMTTGGETSGKDILQAILQMTDGVPGFQLIRHKWKDWHDFRKLVSSMDMLFQPSYTESFNLVTADGIAMGVPSVVSPAITWAPFEWKVDADNALGIAKKAVHILENPYVAQRGYWELEKHNREATKSWIRFLKETR